VTDRIEIRCPYSSKCGWGFSVRNDNPAIEPWAQTLIYEHIRERHPVHAFEVYDRIDPITGHELIVDDSDP